MLKIFIIALLLSSLIYSKPSPYIKKLTLKGEKASKILCKRDIDSFKIEQDLNSSIRRLISSDICRYLDRDRALAIITYLKYKNSLNIKESLKYIKVPKNAKCPVCGMFVYKYPKWSAKMVVGNKSYYFDGVKDMMKFYIFDGDFPFDRDKIKEILVQDFYTLDAIDAKKAYYVVGSNIYGPMGNELIPFKDKESAIEFREEHKGEKIVRFNEITPSLVMGLDGIEFDN